MARKDATQSKDCPIQLDLSSLLSHTQPGDLYSLLSHTQGNSYTGGSGLRAQGCSQSAPAQMGVGWSEPMVLRSSTTEAVTSSADNIPQLSSPSDSPTGPELSTRSNPLPRHDEKSGAPAFHRSDVALPSVGSLYHDIGICEPCVFLHKKRGCHVGKECDFCHSCTREMFLQRKADRRLHGVKKIRDGDQE